MKLSTSKNPRTILVHFPGAQVVERTYRMVNGEPTVKYGGSDWTLTEIKVGPDNGYFNGSYYGYIKAVA